MLFLASCNLATDYKLIKIFFRKIFLPYLVTTKIAFIFACTSLKRKYQSSIELSCRAFR
nr:MAG TPA: hypothetical protein [Caudoviricetes sp.]